MGCFVGTDKHIVPDLADDFYRHIFMLRILHRDEIRMIAGALFPAVDTVAAGSAAAFAEDGLRQQLGQSVFSGTCRS